MAAGSINPASGKAVVHATDLSGSGLRAIRVKLQTGLAIVVCFLMPVIINQGAFDHLLGHWLGIRGGTSLLTFSLFVLIVSGQLALSELDPVEVTFASLLLLLCAVLCATSIWGDSIAYANRKVTLTMTLPAASFLAGVAVVRQGMLHWLLIACLLLGTAFALSWTNYDAATYWELNAIGKTEQTITYQGVSYMLGIGTMGTALLIWRSKDWRLRFVLLALFAYLAMKLLGSGGRGGILYVIAALGAYFLASQSRTMIAIAFAGAFQFISLFAITFTPVQTYLIANQGNLNLPFSIERMVTSVYVQQADERPGEVSRDFLKDQAVVVWGTAPILGVGWGSFPLNAGLGDKSGFYPHNLVYELLAESGVVGLGLFLLLLAAMALAFALKPASVRDKATIWGLLAAALALSMVSADFPNQRLMFFAFGLMVGLPDTGQRVNA